MDAPLYRRIAWAAPLALQVAPNDTQPAPPASIGYHCVQGMYRYSFRMPSKETGC